MQHGPQIGECQSLKSSVDHSRTAMALAADGEALPDVFATPFMIADMERACAAILAPFLDQGQVSVGARIEVSHTAPTQSEARFWQPPHSPKRTAALYWFDVIAEDAKGRIGKGRIARAIVDQATLMSTAGARA